MGSYRVSKALNMAEENREKLNLLFPQWQGCGPTKAVYHGAKRIAEHLKEKLVFTQVGISDQGQNEIEKGIFAYAPIVEQQDRCNTLIKSCRPDRILTIGGDCSVELAPVSYLNSRYQKDLAVIWFDSHGDLNIPEESLSGHFHGMPLRVLLGEGDKRIVDSCFSTLFPDQVILAGARDFDAAEKKFVKQKRIQHWSVDEMTKELKSLAGRIKKQGFTKLYIHIDLDVMDPKEFPYVGYPVENGLPHEALLGVISTLKNSFEIVGMSAVEFSLHKDLWHKGDSSVKMVEKILKTAGFL